MSAAPFHALICIGQIVPSSNTGDEDGSPGDAADAGGGGDRLANAEAIAIARGRPANVVPADSDGTRTGGRFRAENGRSGNLKSSAGGADWSCEQGEQSGETMSAVARGTQLRQAAVRIQAGAPAVPRIRTYIALRLFSADRAALVRYVRRLLPSREDSEDIVQEALLRTCEHAQEVTEPRAFAFTVARNLAANCRRHTRVAKTDPLGDWSQSPVVSTDASVEGEILAEEECRLLREAVERLSPQCRATFTLRILCGYSYREIALRLGVSPKTVENHIGRGLRETNEYMRERYQLMASRRGQGSPTVRGRNFTKLQRKSGP